MKEGRGKCCKCDGLFAGEKVARLQGDAQDDSIERQVMAVPSPNGMISPSLSAQALYIRTASCNDDGSLEDRRQTCSAPLCRASVRASGSLRRGYRQRSDGAPRA